MKILARLTSFFLVTAIAPAAIAQEIADKIFFGGPILTMDDNAPWVEAVAVKDGRIVAVGTQAEIMPHKGADTQTVDLDGKALLPGFVDAHGHVFAIGVQALTASLLAPPDGEVIDISSLQQTLSDWADAHPKRVEAIGAIIGFGYDDSQLKEQRHPIREDLDAVSADLPIYIIHQSGHIGVANSKALEVVGIDANTEEMPGGVIRRDGDGKPDGVLEETPHFYAMTKLFGDLDAKGAAAVFKEGTKLIASYGYTTAQDGRSMPGQVALMEAVAEKGELDIDVVAYPDVLVARDLIEQKVSRDYKNRFRVGGAKLTIDGSPQGFTAWRDRPYYDPPDRYRADYAGYAAVKPEQTFDAIDWAFAKNIQILTHANGEAATDQLLASIKTATDKYGLDDRRPVLIHGQFLREDQVDGLKRLEIFPSLFPMHTFYWGDWHRDRTVGPERADNISPTGWVRKRDMMFSSHHDAPVAFPDSMRILDATVTRRSRSGDIIGPDQRVDVITALKAMTIWPAYQHFEENRKGSIEVGKLADLIVLSDDPTAVNPDTLDDLRVMETIKEGRTIYTAPH